MFLQVCICPQGGRVSASVHAGMPYPPGTRQTPPPRNGEPPLTRQTPPPQNGEPPRTRQMSPGMENPPGPGRPPPGMENNPGKQTPAYGLRAAGTHPTGMHSCLNYFF